MNYQFHNKLVVRTPLKPLKSAFTPNELKELFAEKAAKEALFLASPDLSVEMEKWLAGEITEAEREKKLVASLHKYALRMHTRCTPFGLFAHCSALTWGETTDITLNEKHLFRSTRLDMHFSCQLAQELASAPYIKPYLKFFPSTSIYAVADKFRYVEYDYKNKRRVYQISAVDQSIYLNHVLENAKTGATQATLAETLPILDSDISLDDATDFVAQLIQEQLLISEIEPSVSGAELMVQIQTVLKRISREHPSEELIKVITFIDAILVDIDAIDTAIFNPPSAYINLAEKVKSLNIPYELSKLFQTDLFYHQHPENTIDKNIQYKLQRTLRVLNKITPNPEQENLNDFKRRFYERYEEEEVPLLTVLDNEGGIGYAQNTNHTGDISPLVNNLRVPGKRQERGNTVEWTQLDSVLTQKLLAASNAGEKVVVLNDSDFAGFEENWTNLPNSFSVMFSMAGEKPILGNVGGSSGINLLGRFASGNEEINTIVQEIEEQERELNPHKIIAEVVHLPEARVGNILMRPSFRPYEIPYLSKSDLPLENQIALDDLYVSVRGEKVILRSKKHDKIIAPRLGNAHNYSFKSLPVYHFLCDLQTADERSGLFFHWGKLQSEFNFLPRVEIEGVVVALATWKVKGDPLKELTKKGKKGFAEWHKSLELPPLFLLSEGDNELLFDSTDQTSIETFLATIKNKPTISLKEFLFSKEMPAVKNKTGAAFTNEFVGCLLKTENQVKRAATPKKAVEKLQRNFSIGSEWLYFKVYCGYKTADEIVSEHFTQMAHHFTANGWIDKWFFIRYADPDMHLRVRFHLNDLTHLGTVATAFNQQLQQLMDEGLVWKLQSDTYQREIERYGERTMELSEQLFYYDSENIANVLSLLELDEDGEKIRWLYALRSVHQLLTDVGFDLDEKNDIMGLLRNAFAEEHGMNKHLNKQIDKKYRADKTAIEAVLNPANDTTSEMKPLFDLLHVRSSKNKPLMAELNRLAASNQLTPSLTDLMCSYIHMLLNRLFKNKQRLHELVIYDFLSKKYRSDVGRRKAMEKKAKQVSASN